MNTLTQHFDKLANTDSSFPAWMQELMNKAKATFKAQGFPERSVESYRKTPLNKVMPENCQLAKKPTLNCMNELYRFINKEHDYLTLANSQIEPGLSKADVQKNKMVMMPLSQAFNEFEADLKSAFSDYNADSFLANFALMNIQEGLFIKVPRGQKIDYLHLVSMISSEFDEAFHTETKVIVMEENSQLALLESNVSYFFNKLATLRNTLVIVKKGAQLTHVRVQLENSEAIHLNHVSTKVDRDGSYNSLVLNLGAKFNRTDLSVELKAPGANTHVNGLYALKDSQFSDFHTHVHHQAPNTESDQLYKGILDNTSHGVFNGRIQVDQAAQLIRSSQLNKNLLLSKLAHIDTEPQLMIHADDVKCSHGATIGNLDEDQVFYFQSRGISEEKAKKMLSHAFANDVFMKINHPWIEKKIAKMFYEHYEKDVL